MQLAHTLRRSLGGGPSLVKMDNPRGGSQNTSLWAHNISDPLGTRPALLGLNKTPPFRSDVACYKNPAPDINGPAAAVAPPDPEAVP